MDSNESVQHCPRPLAPAYFQIFEIKKVKYKSTFSLNDRSADCTISPLVIESYFLQYLALLTNGANAAAVPDQTLTGTHFTPG